MMAKFTAENQREWDVQLPLLMMGVPDSSTQDDRVHPQYVNAREAAMPVDLLMGYPPEHPSGTANHSDYAGKLLKRMESVHRFARQHLKRQKRYYDHRGGGKMSQGKMAQGKMSQGKMAQGKMSQGKMAQGKMSQGKMARGKVYMYVAESKLTKSKCSGRGQSSLTEKTN
ncbi:hypothetical protein QZH41_004598 [Actinostola sp. cb2023]|nr:hypothetical protein QZH41_004598 [Actinostola sp. cb2023]